MVRKGYQRLREEALKRLEVSREGKPKARKGRSRQRPPHERKGWPGSPRQDAREYRTNRKAGRNHG